MIDNGPTSLGELEARLQRELELLGEPAANWIRPRTHEGLGPMLDVAVLGAGMAGLAAAFTLIRLGIRNLRLFDRGKPGLEGPWATFARMETLRSPKGLSGPALGLPSLAFRAWFEAQFGARAWEDLGKIPRLQWMEYLNWYRRVLDLPVENGVELVDLEGDEAGAILTLRSARGVRRLAARRVVLATGRDGLGGSTVPPLFRTLPPALRAHSSDPIDFAVLRGKRVAVVGAGASAVDNAAAALEAGAADVTMLVRRPDIPRVNKGTGVANPGLTLGFYDLPPARRWEMTRMIADAQVPPPRDSMLRASRHPGFAVRTDCPVLAVRAEDEEAVLTTRLGDLRFDFVILGTGFSIDWGRRPELSRLSPHVRLWRDAYVPPGQEGHEFADHPFLGPAFEFLERRQGDAPWISRIHCFNFAATLSHGKLTGDIPAISLGAERLGQGIARLTFVEDYPDHRQRLIDYDTPELLGDEWTREVEA